LELSLNFVQYGSFAASVIALTILLAAGKTPERLAGIALFVLMFVSPYAAREGPIAHALLSGAALSLLIVLTLHYERWWLIGAAGLQLVVFTTHFAALVIPQQHIWGVVTLRIVLWQVLILLCLFAIGEGRWATYAQAERVKPNTD